MCDVLAKELRLADGTYRAVSLAARKIAKSAAHSAGSGRDWLRYINEAEQLYRERRREQSRVNQAGNGHKRQMTDLHTMTEALNATLETTRMEELTDLLTGFLDEGSEA